MLFHSALRAASLSGLCSFSSVNRPRPPGRHPQDGGRRDDQEDREERQERQQGKGRAKAFAARRRTLLIATCAGVPAPAMIS